MPPVTPVPPPEPGGSPRVRLARLALAAALAAPDVFEGEVGPNRLRVTADPPAGLLRGVSVTAEPDGRYGVDLRLVAGLVPLPALGEEVQRRVRQSARRAGLAEQLGGINVEFGRLIGPNEALRAGADREAVSAAPTSTESGR